MSVLPLTGMRRDGPAKTSDVGKRQLADPGADSMFKATYFGTVSVPVGARDDAVQL